MIELSTKHKFIIARWISRVLLSMRSLVRLPPTTRVVRQQIYWHIDFREGIDLALYLGVYEPETLKVLAQRIKPGATVLDIGANVGAMTLPLAKSVGSSGHVYAFEPTSWAYDKLQHNLSLNPDLGKRVTAEKLMLLSEGQMPPDFIYSSWNLSAQVDDQTHPSHMGRLMATDSVSGITLDRYFENRPNRINLIKLDVDGYELVVLQGARSLLQRDRPEILLEMAPHVQEERQQLDDLLCELAELGYQLFHLNAKTTIPMNRAVIEKLCPTGGSINVLALAQPR